jgi:hypothetical protein
MASNILLAAAQQAINQTNLLGQINQLLASYGLGTLPAPADATTGLLSSATVTSWLATVAGNQTADPAGRLSVLQQANAANATLLSQWLQLVGLYAPSNPPLTSLPTTITATGALTSSNQIVNGAGTVAITLPSPASMVGQPPIVIKTIAAQLVNSASANVVPIGGGAAGTAILAATIGKWATLVSDGTAYNIVSAN